MSAVFITKYNFGRLTGNQKAHGFGKNGLMMTGSEELLYPHRKIDWFSDLEASRLYLCKILLLEQGHVLFEKILGNRWLEIRTPADNFRSAKAPKKPAYHSDADCAGLHADFWDFLLPANFVEIYGERGVVAFRAWLNTPEQNGRTPLQVLEDNPSRFQIKCEALWPRVQWHNIELQQRANSGIHLFQHFTVQELEAFISNLLESYRAWLGTLPLHIRHLVDSNKRMCRAEGNPELQQYLDQFKKQFKWQMTDALMAYYYQLAAESGFLSVEQNVIEALGFRPCKMCAAH